MIRIDWQLDHPDLRLGVLRAPGLRMEPSSPALDALLRESLAAHLANGGLAEETRRAIRSLVKRGGFKATGRGKPASEYLAQAAQRDEFPRINAAVDLSNLLSLELGWPISLVDERLALADAPGLELRYGRPDEAFVFNAAGHQLDPRGLLGLARSGGPCLANPVKDSMAVKVRAESRDLVAFVYTSTSLCDEAGLAAVLERFATRLRQHAGAGEIETCQLVGPGA